jgi:predicted Fe-S protein YdhL (DUF1289 family)
MNEYEWLDGCFRVEEKRWGTWSSYDKEEKELITSLTKEQCIFATRFYLKGKQEGFEETETYDSVVGGQL